MRIALLEDQSVEVVFVTPMVRRPDGTFEVVFVLWLTRKRLSNAVFVVAQIEGGRVAMALLYDNGDHFQKYFVVAADRPDTVSLAKPFHEVFLRRPIRVSMVSVGITSGDEFKERLRSYTWHIHFTHPQKVEVDLDPFCL